MEEQDVREQIEESAGPVDSDPTMIIIDRRRVDVLMGRVGLETYGELAQVSDVHANTLVRILQGGGWQSKTLKDLALALMCHPFDLLTTRGFAQPSLGAPGEPLNGEEG